MTAARSMLFAGLILAALRPGFAATDPAPVVLYETHLEEGQEAPADWSAEGGGALWGAPGRSGKSLKITTTLGEPKETKWIGPEIPCGQEQALRITGWQASNVIWMQDYLYCGVVAATFFDAQGQEMARGLVANLSPSPKPIRYVYEWFVPEGLFWTSFSGVVKVPAGATTVRPVFAFSHYTESWRDVLLKGDVWVDDLRITSAPLPEPDRPATEPGPQGMTLLGVNTPAEQNLFLPTDNLEFNLALPNQGLPQNLDWGRMRFRYEVYDIERLLLQRGELPLTTTPQRYDENLQLGQGDSGYWLRVFLHEDLKRFQGQWLAVRFTLTDGTSAYAQGDTAFSIMQPRIPPVDQIEQQRLMRGVGAGRYRHLDPPDYYFGTPRTPPFGDEDRPSWREIVGFGGLVPLGAIGGDTWAKTQPTPNSPIDFSAFPPGDPANGFSSQVVPFEERVPSYKYFVHLQVPAAFPDWMIPRDEAGKPITVRSSGSLMTIYPDLDVTAFARWALEAVKHSAATHYTITSMEGPGYPEYPELIRETARMIKAWEPRLKLGVCGPGGVEGARQLKELDLLENLDFLCNDIYSTVVEDREFVTEVRKSKPSFEYILTEYADITGKGHFGLARNTLQFITSALGSGISKITWTAGPIRKNDYQAGRYTWGPDLWSPYESKGDIELTTAARTTGEGPRIVPDNPSALPVVPLLNQIALHHLNRLLGPSTGGEFLPQFSPPCRTFGFLNDDRSLYVSWAKLGTPDFTALLETDAASLELTDMCGRRTTLTPLSGKAFLTLSEDPVFLHFSQQVKLARADVAPVALSGLDSDFVRGEAHEISLSLKSPFPTAVRVRVVPTLDSRWGISPPEREVTLTPDQTTECRFTITAPRELEPGRYPLFLDLFAGERQFGRLVPHINVADNLGLALHTRPLTRESQAEVLVSVRNNKATPAAGTVSLLNPLTAGWEPARLEQKYLVPAHSTRDLVFSLDGQPSLAKRYELLATLADEDGTQLRQEEYAFFIGSLRAPAPLTIDGDLTDWRLEELVPHPFYFLICFDEQWRSLWRDRDECDATMYTRWDADHLYFAFVVTKPEAYNDGEFSGVWPFDCMHVSLYPWGLKKGDSLKAVPYRDHVALDKHGNAIVDRAQSPYPLPATRGYWPEGTEVAIQRTETGYIFELAYPREAVKPLELAAGSRFRLGLGFLYSKPPAPGFIGVGWFYGIGNVDGAPDLHGEIQLVER